MPAIHNAIISTLQTRKLRLRDIGKVAHSNTINKDHHWIQNLDCLGSRSQHSSLLSPVFSSIKSTDQSGVLVHNLDFQLSTFVYWIRIPGGGGWWSAFIMSTIHGIPAHTDLENNWCYSASYNIQLGRKVLNPHILLNCQTSWPFLYLYLLLLLYLSNIVISGNFVSTQKAGVNGLRASRNRKDYFSMLNRIAWGYVLQIRDLL